MVVDADLRCADIRAATLSDLDELAPIWSEFMKVHESLDSYFALSADSLVRWRTLVGEMIQREDGLVLVADTERQAVGYCLGWLARNPPIYAVDTVGFISEIAVRCDLRRKGIGGRLIEEARRWFAVRDISEFQLATAVWNAGAHAFWERIGGRPILMRYRFDVDLDTDIADST